MRIYLAARYSRRLELCQYRDQLRALGHAVQARWLDGGHQIDEQGIPIGERGESLVESGCDLQAALLRAKFASDDWEDVSRADLVINFTDPPRSTANRGGRHVEFGIALALRTRVIVVGYRENIFHWLPRVEFCSTWSDALAKCSNPTLAVQLQDTDPMPWGKHKGTPMQDVPADYLHFLWTSYGVSFKRGPVGDYIMRNMTALKQEHPDGIWT